MEIGECHCQNEGEERRQDKGFSFVELAGIVIVTTSDIFFVW
jgi:hypothetical protein